MYLEITICSISPCIIISQTQPILSYITFTCVPKKCLKSPVSFLCEFAASNRSHGLTTSNHTWHGRPTFKFDEAFWIGSARFIPMATSLKWVFGLLYCIQIPLVFALIKLCSPLNFEIRRTYCSPCNYKSELYEILNIALMFIVRQACGHSGKLKLIINFKRILAINNECLISQPIISRSTDLLNWTFFTTQCKTGI
jgi:hypothetical protein